MAEPSPLLALLREPQTAPRLTERQWDRVLHQGRVAVLLGQLGAQLVTAGVMDAVPSLVQAHVKAARLLADKIVRDLRFELAELDDVLAPAAVPVVLLKGAAYAAGGLPPAPGRIFGDLDILVPKAALGTIETLLRRSGWTTTPLDPRDQAYYRRWAHELPPLVHKERGTILDVHHDIAQSRSTASSERAALWHAAIPWRGCLALPQPTDLVLHAAVHLIDDGEFDKGTRDLVDFWLLARHFAAESGFLAKLAARSRSLGLSRPLYYALRHAERLLGLDLPAGHLAELRPSLRRDWLMDPLFGRALRPAHPTAADAFVSMARGLLYLRGHYLRMPLLPLAGHLLAKSLRSRSPSPGRAAAARLP